MMTDYSPRRYRAWLYETVDDSWMDTGYRAKFDMHDGVSEGVFTAINHDEPYPIDIHFVELADQANYRNQLAYSIEWL